MIALITIILFSCSSVGTGKNGTPGQDGSSASGTKNGKSGAIGKNGMSHLYKQIIKKKEAIKSILNSLFFCI